MAGRTSKNKCCVAKFAGVLFKFNLKVSREELAFLRDCQLESGSGISVWLFCAVRTTRTSLLTGSCTSLVHILERTYKGCRHWQAT